jgi:effector-associated domain 1 (EAD1)-containing protein/trypsin-like peptidase
MASLDLKGPQRVKLSTALGSAFTVQRLREALDFKLEKRLEDISLGGDYAQIRFEVIQAAEAQGWTAELVVAAREDNPGNAPLLAFAEEVGLASSTPRLERILREESTYFDVEAFRTRLGEIETRVCRIEVPTAQGSLFGTGFLAGPSVVMTNHHVLEPVIRNDGTANPEQVTFLFDHKVLDGTVVNPGTSFGLAQHAWLVDHSPISPLDLRPEPKGGSPQPDELDYALVQLAGEPGEQPVGKGDARAPPRGWLTVPLGPFDFVADCPLIIVQHPNCRPLKLALEMNGVIGLNANGTRVKHRVNTEGGSSGSPCFDSRLELVGVHHGGDPNFDLTHSPEYNEAIPLAPILALLEQRGKRDELGGKAEP